MGLYAVYVHKMPNGKVYVGITGQEPTKRWKNGKGYPQNQHLSNAVKRYGWEKIEHIIVADGLSKEQAAEMEKQLIRQYRSNEQEFGYNQSTGGENPAEGSRWTEETKKKVSASLLGKKHTEEHNEKISKAKKGKPNGLEGRKGVLCGKSGLVKQISEETGDVVAEYHGFPEARRLTGYALTPMKEAAKGVRKRAYGYLWKYEEVKRNVLV